MKAVQPKKISTATSGAFEVDVVTPAVRTADDCMRGFPEY